MFGSASRSRAPSEAEVLAIAAASVDAVAASAGRSGRSSVPTRRHDVDRARQNLARWCADVGAPSIELRRAISRISASWERASRKRIADALAVAEPAEAARQLVEALSDVDRDFEWDVPLRDVARAVMTSAVNGARR